MIKKWICLILAVVLACSLCACGNNKQPTSYDPTDYEQVAKKFIEAYYTRDRLTIYPMYFYDIRQQKEDELRKLHGSNEAFFAEVEKQAEEKGIAADIASFDDYYAAYYRFIQEDMQNLYGDYTIATEVTETTKMDDNTFATFCDAQLGAIDAKYIDGDALRAATQAYTLKVHLQIDGTLKDFSESYLVHLVWHEDRWMVVSHSI